MRTITHPDEYTLRTAMAPSRPVSNARRPMTATKTLELCVWLSALLLVASGLPAQAQRADPAPVATGDIVGTTLMISPQVAYVSATLRISGPGEFALSRHFPADTAIAADLLLDSEPRAEEASGRNTRVALSDGRYRYEVVLDTGSGELRHHSGLIYVQNGSPVMRAFKQAALRAIRQDLASTAMSPDEADSQGEIGAQDIVNEYVAIVDSNHDGTTILTLDSFDDYPEPGADRPIWSIRNVHGDLDLLHYDAGVKQYLPRMAVEADGSVGIRTLTPLADLHVYAPGFANRVRLQAGAGLRDLVTLGDGGFEIQGAGGNGERAVRIFPAVPDNSLVLHTAGVGIGTAAPQATFHVAGSGRIDGDVALGSSRALKTAFEAVGSSEILAKIAELPLASWRYKSEDESTRHIGPFAEDFQRLFGLGDGETISVIDAQGVALAGIQGLDRKLDGELTRLRAENARLARENDALQQRIETIEHRLETLAAGDHP